MAKLVTLIETQERRGLGKTEDDPIRLVRQWWTVDGELVVEKDEWLEEKAREKVSP